MNQMGYWFRVAGFVLVGCGSFAIWAFGSQFFASEMSLYSACAIVFLLLGGVSLLPYSGMGSNRVNLRLLWLFPLAFVIYAVTWCFGWFTFRNHFGEIMGSAIGILAITSVFKLGLRFKTTVFEAASVVFFCYTIGYYLGEKAYQVYSGTPGKLGWGVGFGLGMGAGLSYLVAISRRIDR